MNRRRTLVSAALAAVLLLAGVAAWRLVRATGPADGRVAWQRSAERWRARATDALEQKVTPSSPAVLADLIADAQRMLREQPPGANPSELRFTLSRVEGFAEKVQRVDWEQVTQWEQDVHAVAEGLQRVLNDARKWEEERLAALRTAEARWGELRAGRPWGADPDVDDEIQRVLTLARTALPTRRR